MYVKIIFFPTQMDCMPYFQRYLVHLSTENLFCFSPFVGYKLGVTKLIHENMIRQVHLSLCVLVENRPTA